MVFLVEYHLLLGRRQSLRFDVEESPDSRKQGMGRKPRREPFDITQGCLSEAEGKALVSKLFIHRRSLEQVLN